MNKIINEWLTRADSDLEEAEFLLKHRRPLHDVAFFIHQAAEKYVKCFLISKGWELEKIHDLEKLVKECIRIDASFRKFAEPLRKITRFYIESRYPVSYKVKYGHAELKEDIKVVKEIAKIIKANLPA